MDKHLKIIIISVLTILTLVTIGIIIFNIVPARNQEKGTAVTKLVQQLPYETEEFKVEHTGSVTSGKYTISLYAILNGDSQLEQYNIDLKQYKQDSIKWLNDNGVNPSKIKIIWLPEEAAKL